MPTAVEKWKQAHPAELEKLLEACGHRCVLCRKRFSKSRPYALDHRHTDGLVRGVPCASCNEKLGHDHDDAGWYARASHYLDNPPAVKLIGIEFVPGSLGDHRRSL